MSISLMRGQESNNKFVVTSHLLIKVNWGRKIFWSKMRALIIWVLPAYSFNILVFQHVEFSLYSGLLPVLFLVPGTFLATLPRTRHFTGITLKNKEAEVSLTLEVSGTACADGTLGLAFHSIYPKILWLPGFIFFSPTRL